MRGFFTGSLVLISFALAGQGTGDWWYFGNFAGLHFTTSGPVAVSDGQLVSWEGCATMSNAAGELRFYTNGENVWDSTHTVMPNGTGLLGNMNSTQSAVIVPYPGFPDKYYIFTTRSCTGGYEDTASKFAYSVVDMALNNGLGDIESSSKNTVLFDSASEKCTVIPHANGIDYWVMGHTQPGNTFYTFLVTSTGIADTVLTSAGMDHDTACAGYMATAPNGQHIAVALTVDSAPVELYPFDNLTGTLGTPDSLFHDNWSYGLQFSPNSQVLYVSSYGGVSPYTTVYQYDLTAANIQASEYAVTDFSAFGMSTGPDGMIYIAHLNASLSRIQDPDALGASCNYQGTGVVLTALSGFGLPAMILHDIPNPSFSYSGKCVGKTVSFELVGTNADSVFWNFGDPASGASNTATDVSPAHVFTDTGYFDVALVVYLGTQVDTVTQEVFIYPHQTADLGGDTALCVGQSITYAVTQPYATFLWQDGSAGDTIAVQSDSQVSVTVFGACDTLRDSVSVVFHSFIGFGLGPDTVLCDTVSAFVLDAGLQVNADVFWSTGDTTDVITVSAPGTYIMSASNACNTAVDSVEVTFKALPPGSLLPGDTVHCFDTPLVFAHPQLKDVSFVWSDSSVAKNYTVNTTEMLWLAAFNECGSSADTLNVIFAGEIKSDLGGDTMICDRDSIVLRATWPGAAYQWNTGDTADTIWTVSEEMNYSVTVTRGVCEKTSSIRVEFNDIACKNIDCKLQYANVFTPNGDGINDVFRAWSDCDIHSFDLSIYNRWGQLVHQSHNAAFGWDGYINGERAPAGTYYFRIQFQDLVVVDADGNTYQGSITLVR